MCRPLFSLLSLGSLVLYSQSHFRGHPSLPFHTLSVDPTDRGTVKLNQVVHQTYHVLPNPHTHSRLARKLAHLRRCRGLPGTAGQETVHPKTAHRSRVRHESRIPRFP